MTMLAILGFVLLLMGLVKAIGMWAEATHPKPAPTPPVAARAAEPATILPSTPALEVIGEVPEAILEVLAEASRKFLGKPVELVSVTLLGEAIHEVAALPGGNTAVWSREGRREITHSHRLK